MRRLFSWMGACGVSAFFSVMTVAMAGKKCPASSKRGFRCQLICICEQNLSLHDSPAIWKSDSENSTLYKKISLLFGCIKSLSYARIPWKTIAETHKHPEQPCYYRQYEPQCCFLGTSSRNWLATGVCWWKKECAHCCIIYLIEINDVGYLVPWVRVEQ